MIHGAVSTDGVPVIPLKLAGDEHSAIVDTGFNNSLELPIQLKSALAPSYIGHGWSVLAGGQEVEEAWYAIEIEFDGEQTLAEAVFVEGVEVLVGTALLENHKLTIDFPAGTVLLERVTTSPEGIEMP